MTVTLNILEIGARGDGVAEEDGQRYFVPFALPGEIVEAEARVAARQSEEIANTPITPREEANPSSNTPPPDSVAAPGTPAAPQPAASDAPTPAPATAGTPRPQ